MKPLKDIVPTDSSIPTFGPTHEIFTAINAFSNDLGTIKREIAEIKERSSQIDVVCKAYKDLHAYRLIFLISTTALFVISSFGVMYLIGSKYPELDFILRLIAGTTGIGLIVECFYLPSKIRDHDKQLTDLRGRWESCKRDIDEVTSKLPDKAQPNGSGSPTVKKKK